MTFHTIGDSHCCYGWHTVPQVMINPIGPKLCFSIARDGIDLSKFTIKQGDTVVFCLGEIDCRCHVHKYINNTTTYETVINEIVARYFVRIREAVERIGKLKVCIYNVVPPVQKFNEEQNPEYPHLGTDEERKTYVLYFNKKLKEKCREYGYVFFDIYDKYTDSNGFLKRELSDGRIHIANGIHIRNFINQNRLR